MLAELAVLLPEGISGASALVLLLVAALTSAVTAAVGIGGGLLLLAVMAVLVPASALVPVHAVAQLGSNAGRSALLARRVRWSALAWFVPGAALGVAAGGSAAVELPPSLLRAGIGLFVLWAAWGRPVSAPGGRRLALLAGGALSSVLTMFVGATGPFVLALFRGGDLEKEALVATTAVAMTLQHGLKIVAFGVLGFAFGEWLPLVGAMVAAGFVGTVLGTRLLRRLPEAGFRRALRWILTAVALQLLLTALL